MFLLYIYSLSCSSHLIISSPANFNFNNFSLENFLYFGHSFQALIPNIVIFHEPYIYLSSKTKQEKDSQMKERR